jgi:hypothetical protein
VFAGETFRVGMMAFVRQAGPRMLGLVLCDEGTDEDYAYLGRELGGDRLDYAYDHLYRVRLARWSLTDVEPWLEDWQVWYLPHAACLPGGFVGAKGDWKDVESFTEFVRRVADAVVADPEEQAIVEADDSEPPPWDKLPWLLRDEYE